VIFYLDSEFDLELLQVSLAPGPVAALELPVGIVGPVFAGDESTDPPELLEW